LKKYTTDQWIKAFEYHYKNVGPDAYGNLFSFHYNPEFLHYWSTYKVENGRVYVTSFSVGDYKVGSRDGYFELVYQDGHWKVDSTKVTMDYKKRTQGKDFTPKDIIGYLEALTFYDIVYLETFNAIDNGGRLDKRYRFSINGGQFEATYSAYDGANRDKGWEY